MLLGCLDVCGEQSGRHADGARPGQCICHDVLLTFDKVEVDVELEQEIQLSLLAGRGLVRWLLSSEGERLVVCAQREAAPFQGTSEKFDGCEGSKQLAIISALLALCGRELS